MMVIKRKMQKTNKDITSRKYGRFPRNVSATLFTLETGSLNFYLGSCQWPSFRVKILQLSHGFP